MTFREKYKIFEHLMIIGEYEKALNWANKVATEDSEKKTEWYKAHKIKKEKRRES